MFKKLLLTAIAVSCLSSVGWAQRIEITPFVGYKFGGSVPIRSDEFPDVDRFKFDNSISYGINAGYNITEHFGVEFMWDRQDTNTVAQLRSGGSFDEKVSTKIDQYHGNFLYNFRDGDAKLRPFVLVGLGATRASGAGNSQTKFSFGLGGGVKYFFTPNMGLRAQARWSPTYLYTTSGGVWCNWWGYCWTIPNDHFMNQGEVSVGWIFRF